MNLLRTQGEHFYKILMMATSKVVHGDAWLVGWLPIDPRIRIEAWPGHPP